MGQHDRRLLDAPHWQAQLAHPGSVEHADSVIRSSGRGRVEILPVEMGDDGDLEGLPHRVGPRFPCHSLSGNAFHVRPLLDDRTTAPLPRGTQRTQVPVPQWSFLRFPTRR